MTPADRILELVEKKIKLKPDVKELISNDINKLFYQVEERDIHTPQEQAKKGVFPGAKRRTRHQKIAAKMGDEGLFLEESRKNSRDFLIFSSKIVVLKPKRELESELKTARTCERCRFLKLECECFNKDNDKN